jgi:hypothetical protein
VWSVVAFHRLERQHHHQGSNSSGNESLIHSWAHSVLVAVRDHDVDVPIPDIQLDDRDENRHGVTVVPALERNHIVLPLPRPVAGEGTTTACVACPSPTTV